MLGLSIGDALGAPVEFTKKDSLKKIEHYRRGEKFNVEIGEYTDDTDTVGAVYGQLAGAYYGTDSITTEYKEGLMRREIIEELALKLI